jgi:hypothetical protein
MGAAADYDRDVHPRNRLANVRRRVRRARRFPTNTCPASRHLQLMADCLAAGQTYSMFEEEPHHCASTMYVVLEALWKARTELAKHQATAHAISAGGK